MADKFRKMSCLNVYGRKRGRMGVKQCMHSFHSLDCLLGVFFYDYMSKLFPTLLNKKSEIVSICNHRKKHLVNNLRNERNACTV